MPKTFSTTSKPTTNANLTGVITSVGNATSIASQTGTGTKFVVDTSPVLVTPNIGTPSAGVLTNATGLPAASVLAGSLGTGAYVMDTSLTVPLINGSSAANGDITINGTSSGTKTTSYVILQDTGGNVGIGTTSPTGRLEIVPESGSTVYPLKVTTAANQNIVGQFSANSCWSNLFRFQTNGGNYWDFGTNRVLTDNSFSIYSSTAGTDVLHITTSGNVGIGTTAPGKLLSVGANLWQADVNGIVWNNNAKTTYNGSVSGTAVWSQPFQGSAYKKFIIYLAALNDVGGTITFPTAFSHTPVIYGTAASLAICTASTTTFTIGAAATITGYVICEGD
jgi:hypothetical protein